MCTPLISEWYVWPALYIHIAVLASIKKRLPTFDLNITLTDGHSFESFHHQIYPEELQLNKENEDNNNTIFLDLGIKIDNGIFNTAVFDKRDDFGFNITRLPYRCSNIPHKMFYASAAAECLRICRATSSEEQAVLKGRFHAKKVFEFLLESDRPSKMMTICKKK